MRRNHRLRELKRGDCFGEMCLMDFSPRSASVQAVENCTALEISTACLHQICELDLAQFAMIEMNMGREVSRRLRDLSSVRDVAFASRQLESRHHASRLWVDGQKTGPTRHLNGHFSDQLDRITAAKLAEGFTPTTVNRVMEIVRAIVRKA